MKPNPVKKTIEYCVAGCDKTERCRHAEYCAEEYSMRCGKYNAPLGNTGARIERPQWCTDETSVRVKIEPVDNCGEEMCLLSNDRCNKLWSVTRGADMIYLCGITGETFFRVAAKKRPEACRKLEVE